MISEHPNNAALHKSPPLQTDAYLASVICEFKPIIFNGKKYIVTSIINPTPIAIGSGE